MADLFVSFASPDLASAEGVVAAAERMGIHQVFLDRSERTGIQLGEEWERALIREIRSAEPSLMIDLEEPV